MILVSSCDLKPPSEPRNALSGGRTNELSFTIRAKLDIYRLHKSLSIHTEIW